MNQLNQIFKYHQKEVRVVVIENKVYFVAKDVCEILEHSDTRKAVSRLDDDEKLIGTIFLSGQNRDVWLINEAGLYTLILTSRKPEAKAFKRWITHEVIPSIRQTGQYSLQNQSQFKLPTTYKEALLELIAKVEDNERLLHTIIEQKPKVELYDTLMNADGCQNIGQVAKSLGWGRNRLYAFLRNHQVLIDSRSPYKRNLPYQQYINNGYFKVINTPHKTHKGMSISQQTLVTPKGAEFIVKLVKEYEQLKQQYIDGIKALTKAGVYDEYIY